MCYAVHILVVIVWLYGSCVVGMKDAHPSNADNTSHVYDMAWMYGVFANRVQVFPKFSNIQSQDGSLTPN